MESELFILDRVRSIRIRLSIGAFRTSRLYSIYAEFGEV
jgi:hypothetical protein